MLNIEQSPHILQLSGSENERDQKMRIYIYFLLTKAGTQQSQSVRLCCTKSLIRESVDSLCRDETDVPIA